MGFNQQLLGGEKMFLTATFKNRADQHDLPYIGKIMRGYYEGVKVSFVVKEIQRMKWLNPEWQENNEMPVLQTQLLVQIDEDEFIRKKRKQQAVNENNLVVIDGGIGDVDVDTQNENPKSTAE